jgi:hypothetical protein
MAPKKKRSHEDPRLPAAVAMLGRTGAQEFQLRFSPEDEKPITWTALANWGDNRWECAASMDPLVAVFRLCDQVIDGGQCTHCQKPTGFTPDLDPMPLNQFVCWYQWDPERKTFRRGCEGDKK